MHFLSNMYDSGMDTQKRELWDRLENEPERACRAFESFLSLPSGKRTLLEAYRQHVGNPDAAKPSDTWSGWCSDFAWRERAAAHDDHLASVRREAYERVIEEETTRQAREVEKARGRYNELMTMSYVQAMEWFENAHPSDLRSQDVIQIIKLHQEDIKTFGPTEKPDDEDDWTEEDNARFDEIIKEVDALADLEHPEEGEESEDHSDESGGEEP
jgi:hypothetical protein